MGRPKKGYEKESSLQQIVSCIEKLLGKEIQFADDCVSKSTLSLTSFLKSGQVVLLENLRFYSEEKKGDVDFAKKLASHGDVYINDAFGTAHRAHASTSIIAQFFPNDKMFGYLIEREIKSVEKVLNSNEKPVTAIIGGAKVSSKISIISNLLDKVDNIIIGGGMAYTFIKAKGGRVGNSLVENDYLSLALEIIDNANKKGVNLLLPIDTIIADQFSNEANVETCKIDEIPNEWLGLDIGNESINIFSETIASSKLILWNGPMGVFELEAFSYGTKQISIAVANSTKNGAFSLVGGGDSVAAVVKFNLSDNISHISTGGGAMLEYLEGKNLPGLESIVSHLK
jgi:phosphoglycerate kinase